MPIAAPWYSTVLTYWPEVAVAAIFILAIGWFWYVASKLLRERKDGETSRSIIKDVLLPRLGIALILPFTAVAALTGIHADIIATSDHTAQPRLTVDFQSHGFGYASYKSPIHDRLYISNDSEKEASNINVTVMADSRLRSFERGEPSQLRFVNPFIKNYERGSMQMAQVKMGALNPGDPTSIGAFDFTAPPGDYPMIVIVSCSECFDVDRNTHELMLHVTP